jgi:hypothetical protein
MTYPPGVPDPGSDFRCQRCGLWVVGASICTCVAGPLRAADCAGCGKEGRYLDADGWCQTCRPNATPDEADDGC